MMRRRRTRSSPDKDVTQATRKGNQRPKWSKSELEELYERITGLVGEAER